ncbi:MAG: hypothetical protein ACM33B_14070, partial [Pseudomonadota bacterium]
ETLVVAGDDVDVRGDHLAFHLAAGVDLVLVSGATQGAAEALADDRVRVVPETSRTALARAAATEHGADWLLDADPDEFWWPRSESLKDALAPMPARYGVVQGLVRTFPPQPGDGAALERMTRRPSLEPPAVAEPIRWALRPVYRADPELVVGETPRGRVPLRAWYPFEVLRFPLRDAAQAERRLARAEPRSELEQEAAAARTEGRLADAFSTLGRGRPLVEDVRVRDALAAIRAGAAPPFRAPDVVDDAAYAVECAAVGEVDLPKLERYVAELEQRIAVLEQRFWPRVQRRLARAVRRT